MKRALREGSTALPPFGALSTSPLLLLLPLAIVLGACQTDPPIDASDTDVSGSSGGTWSGDETEGDEESTGTGTDEVCGNGVIEADEECDDEVESATCNDDCTLANCGDSRVNVTAGEDCDDGGESANCNANCTLARCGDMVVNAAAGEKCDNGGESLSCDADCTAVVCGDGVTNATAGETCDDGGESAICDVDCTLAECGDGVFNASANEECDDTIRTAACDPDCTLAECGDGHINPISPEQCDDAGESAACNADCTIAICGDGVTNATAGEDCDDAGESMTCNADCTSTTCGDGVTNTTAGEDCDDAGESTICNADCTSATCGDGVTNATAGEDCDDAGESAGCDADCTTVVCGDDSANATAGEACDGLDLAGGTCETQGYLGGMLACDGGCGFDTNGCSLLPPPTLQLSFSQVKQFDFSWMAVMGADYYQLQESAAPGDPFVQLGMDIVGTSVSHTMPLHFQYQASYRLLACDAAGCSQSAVVGVVSSLADAVGYFKASNTDLGDEFGWSVALSGDGNTLAVGAFEGSNATGVGGDQTNNSSSASGAVYVFSRDGTGTWAQEAYIKASNTDLGDEFGWSVALSEDGNTLAVGAYGERSSATGIGGDQANNFSVDAGAVYVFSRDGMGTWAQEAYVKASNTDSDDRFGHSVALSGDGNTLAVGAWLEDSNASGIGGDQADNSLFNSGAVYVFSRDGMGTWAQEAYVKASNTNSFDRFGHSVALSEDGNTLAVGADGERSNATGIGGDQANNFSIDAGAVYVFSRSSVGTWAQEAYVKASNTGSEDVFGRSVALSGDGNTLAVGAPFEDSNASGIGGDGANNSSSNSGAVYVFSRSSVGTWAQEAYVKASNTGSIDQFGQSLVLSGDGNTLAVGATREDSDATGIGGDQANNFSSSSGTVYVLSRDGMGMWSQEAYVKASNTGSDDRFGQSVALSGDGNTLAVGAMWEQSNATGLGGDQANNASDNSGAVYLY